jgi:hypothetical protein
VVSCLVGAVTAEVRVLSVDCGEMVAQQPGMQTIIIYGGRKAWLVAATAANQQSSSLPSHSLTERNRSLTAHFIGQNLQQSSQEFAITLKIYVSKKEAPQQPLGLLATKDAESLSRSLSTTTRIQLLVPTRIDTTSAIAPPICLQAANHLAQSTKQCKATGNCLT